MGCNVSGVPRWVMLLSVDWFTATSAVPGKERAGVVISLRFGGRFRFALYALPRNGSLNSGLLHKRKNILNAELRVEPWNHLDAASVGYHYLAHIFGYYSVMPLEPAKGLERGVSLGHAISAIVGSFFETVESDQDAPGRITSYATESRHRPGPGR